ncbi:hypothetical protein [Geomicrobium sediminis]|uniref:Uncharacterized protein n=1 Tax=Geomicrobium sediminis TaxID=1347788 RepID=A0ABS2PAJ7_9BACL|nr:hypothetical protein [Geomicrobium sediminis]MBM7632415.1 hypothetical protein [Geomicrobium sediminis]
MKIALLMVVSMLSVVIASHVEPSSEEVIQEADEKDDEGTL